MKSGKNILKILCIICLLQILLTIYLILKVYVSNVLRPDTAQELEQGESYENPEIYNAADSVINEANAVKLDREILKTERVLLKNKNPSLKGLPIKKVEIWSNAAIGSYLWQYILGGRKSVNSENPSLYTGFITTQGIQLIYKEGPGLMLETVSTDVFFLVLVLNGRTPEKVVESKRWLNKVINSTPTIKVVVVMLGNENCKNSWIKKFLFPEGPVRGAFITYDDPMVNDDTVFQWPLGVATYRHFPLLTVKETNPSRVRKFICNIQATNYVNSSRTSLFSFLNSNNGSDSCLVRERKEWLPAESSTSSKEYVNILLDSDLTLCPSGYNTETYRVYEAMEAGSIPVIEDVPSKGSCDPKTGWRHLKSFHPPVIWVSDWNELPNILKKEKRLKAQTKAKRREKLLNWLEWFKLRNKDNFLAFFHKI